MPSSTQQVLVLAPHPDDETFGCGGTIKLLTNSGIGVDVAFMTSGELGNEVPETLDQSRRKELAEARELEARSACDVLGVRRAIFLHGPDGQLADCPLIAARLAGLFLERDYSRVFCPGPQEAHPDHLATYRWFRRSLAQYRGTLDVWLYEVWTPLQPNMLIPIDATMPDKQRAMRSHDSQLRCRDYSAAFAGLAAYRALSCPPSQFAEAFHILNSRLLPEVS